MRILKNTFVGLVFVFFLGFTFATTTYHNKTENGKSYQVMKVVLDGKSKFVVPALEKGAKSLKDLMEGVGGIHAINGGFFCPDEAAYSWCGIGTTDGLRVFDGNLYSRWRKSIGRYRSVFGFDINGKPIMVLNKGSYEQDEEIDNVYNGMMMPVLVSEGKNVAIFNEEMNNDAKQKIPGNKTFICTTKDESTIYMGYVNGVTFSDLADYIIKTFSCYNAMQLDNGGTKAMIYNGKYVAGPGRNMMDAFVVIEDVDVEKNDKITNTTISTTNNEYAVNQKIKKRVDAVMAFVDRDWSKKYSINQQISIYQNLILSFSKTQFYGEQKESIEYLIYLFEKKLTHLKSK